MVTFESGYREQVRMGGQVTQVSAPRRPDKAGRPTTRDDRRFIGMSRLFVACAVIPRQPPVGGQFGQGLFTSAWVITSSEVPTSRSVRCFGPVPLLSMLAR